MSRQPEVTIISPVYLEQSMSPLYITEAKPGDPPGVRGFLKINPKMLGLMEILIGGVAFGLLASIGLFLTWTLLSPFFLVLTGVITATAACTRNSCLVVTSQVLHFLVIIQCAVYFFYFFVMLSRFSHGLQLNLTMIYTILQFILSVIVFSSVCCCVKSRTVTAIQMITAPISVINDTMNHPAPRTPPYNPAYSPVPSTEPPAYSPVPSTEPPAYSPVPSTEPPAYSPVPSTEPPAYSPVPSTEPPAYSPVPSTEPPGYKNSVA